MKNALVLGVTGSLGTSIANSLLSEGYSVVGSYHEGSSIESFALKDKVKVYPLDMESTTSIDSFVDSIKDVESLDFFTSTIANTLTLERFEKIDIETFKKDFDINFFNYIYFLRKLIPKLSAGSNIIFILSQMVIEPQKNFSPYITSKYALLGLMKCLEKEFEDKKIRVNSVSPSRMNTTFLWEMNLKNKKVSVPKAIKDKQLASEKFLSTDKVADEIIKIIKDDSMSGENVLIK